MGGGGSGGGDLLVSQEKGASVKDEVTGPLIAKLKRTVRVWIAIEGGRWATARYGRRGKIDKLKPCDSLK